MGRLNDLQAFDCALRAGVNLRTEEVYSANSIADLKNINLRINKTMRMLMFGKKLIDITNGWSKHVNTNFSTHVNTIQSTLDSVNKEGIWEMSKDKIIQLHSAESLIGYFMHKHLYKLFDYKMVKKLLREEAIKEINYSKVKTVRTRRHIKSRSKKSTFANPIAEVEQKTGLNLYKRGHFYANMPYFFAMVYLCLPQSDTCGVDKRSFVLTLLANFVKNNYTCNKTLTLVKNPIATFKENNVKNFTFKRKSRGETNHIFITGIIHPKDILRGLQNPVNYKRRLLASLLFGCSGTKEEIKIILTDLIRSEFQVFPRRLIDTNSSRYTWNRLFNPSDEIAPSMNGSSTMRSISNLKQFSTKDKGKVTSIIFIVDTCFYQLS